MRGPDKLRDILTGAALAGKVRYWFFPVRGTYATRGIEIGFDPKYWAALVIVSWRHGWNLVIHAGPIWLAIWQTTSGPPRSIL